MLLGHTLMEYGRLATISRVSAALCLVLAVATFITEADLPAELCPGLPSAKGPDQAGPGDAARPVRGTLETQREFRLEG